MKSKLMSVALIATLAGCGGQFSNPFSGPNSKAPPAPVDTTAAPAPKPEIVEVGTGGQTAASLDTTTAAQKTAATSAPASGAVLGTTVASLGDVGEQGFWLRTPLVSAVTEGSVEAENGAVVQVKLIPIDGPASAGSRISLAAMRALSLGLTDLARLKVYAK